MFSLLLSVFFFSCYAAHRDLHSFPTRRSSDLPSVPTRAARRVRSSAVGPDSAAAWRVPHRATPAATRARNGFQRMRSEEHTSELQSQSNLVCRLLLEKKKNHINS